MNISKPHFELARVYDDGTRETEIVSVVRLPWDTKMDRRGFLGAGATAGAVLGALTAACAPEDETRTRDAKGSDIVLGECGWRTAHQDHVQVFAVSPDGKLLASGSSDKTIKLWDLPEGALRKTLEGHESSVDALAIGPDGKLLASGSSDNTIKLWGLPEGALRRTLEPHKYTITALAISPDGKLLASGSSDNTVKLWGLPQGALRKTLKGHKGTVRALAISADGKLLASGSNDNTINLWSLSEGALRKTLDGHKGSVTALAISRDGELLVSGSNDNNIKFWALPEGALRKTLDEHKYSVTALAISPDSKLLASGRTDKTISIWRLPEGELHKTLAAHRGWVYALAISPDGKILVSGGDDRTIKLWGLPDGRFKACLNNAKAEPPPASTPVSQGSGGGAYTYCTCNKVCTCIPVRCQAHRVLHQDSVVRTMAEELLLLMGRREFEYMAWAADKAEPPLRARIHEIMQAIEAGALPDPDRWPSPNECIARLDDPDEIIALMAAQMLAQKMFRRGLSLDDSLCQRLCQLNREACEHSLIPRERGARRPISHALAE
jgi:uncharacterized delta-60 repeat protein